MGGGTRQGDATPLYGYGGRPLNGVLGSHALRRVGSRWGVLCELRTGGFGAYFGTTNLRGGKRLRLLMRPGRPVTIALTRRDWVYRAPASMIGLARCPRWPQTTAPGASYRVRPFRWAWDGPRLLKHSQPPGKRTGDTSRQ